MKILAIDTSTNACSAALMIDQKIIERFEVAPMKQTQFILPMVDALLSQSELSLTQLDGLTFASGPGSFTGVRIATGVIQGLAFGAHLSVVPVSTLAVLAQGAVREHNAQKILVALDAKMGQIYWGKYEVGQDGLVRPMQKDSVINPDVITQPTDMNWIGVGSGWDEYGTILKAICGDCLQFVYPEALPHAQDLLKLAEAGFQNGQSVAAHQVLPIYLRDKIV